MSILDRIIGRAPVGGPQISAAPGQLPPISDLPLAPRPELLSTARNERPISVYDRSGRKIEVGREAWRKDVLLPNLAASRDNPDSLLQLISDGLRDDFAADVLDDAQRLHDQDPLPRRALLLASVLFQLKDFTGARAVLERAIGRHGETAYLLSGLARALAELGDAARAEELIWRALGLDPNEDSALKWVAAHSGPSAGPAATLAAQQGITIGVNLLRALVGLGKLTEARNLLAQLHARQRPDWREQLLEWEHLLDDAHKRYGEATASPEIIVMRFEKPVWSRGVLGFEAVLPRKTASAPHIHVVCASGVDGKTTNTAIDGRIVPGPTNEIGRITRALPMFFAEELCLRTAARSAFLLPWMKQGGFVLSARPWSRALLPPDQPPPALLIFTHIDATHSPWMVRVTLEQPLQPAAPIVVFEQAFGLATAAQDAALLLRDLLARVTAVLAVRCEEETAALAAPNSLQLPGYLTGLDQALAVALAARQNVGETFLYEERAIFEHLFEVATSGAHLLRPRMLLVNALENQARRRPDIVREYLDKLLQLQERHDLGEIPGAQLLKKAVHTVADKARAAR